MFGVKKSILAVAMVSICAPLASVCAEEAKPAAGTEKQAVVKELLEASRVTANAKLGFNLVMDQEMKGINAALENSINRNTKLTAEEREKSKKTLTAKIDRRLTRFRQISEEKINISQLTTDVYLTLYDKYFTVEQLKDMVAFYKSPTGQRSLDVLPQLSNEAVGMINKTLLPKIREVTQQLEVEEKEGKI